MHAICCLNHDGYSWVCFVLFFFLEPLCSSYPQNVSITYCLFYVFSWLNWIYYFHWEYIIALVLSYCFQRHGNFNVNNYAYLYFSFSGGDSGVWLQSSTWWWADNHCRWHNHQYQERWWRLVGRTAQRQKRFVPWQLCKSEYTVELFLCCVCTFCVLCCLYHNIS